MSGVSFFDTYTYGDPEDLTIIDLKPFGEPYDYKKKKKMPNTRQWQIVEHKGRHYRVEVHIWHAEEGEHYCYMFIDITMKVKANWQPFAKKPSEVMKMEEELTYIGTIKN